MKKLLPIFIVVILIVGGGAFYGGMKYQESKTPKGFVAGDFKNLRNLSTEERQQRSGQLAANTGAGFKGMGNGNLAGGEIIAKDAESITVKLPDGGSKIIFFSESTDITKSASGSADDLAIGEQVMISGLENADGSYTAKTIQMINR